MSSAPRGAPWQVRLSFGERAKAREQRYVGVGDLDDLAAAMRAMTDCDLRGPNAQNKMEKIDERLVRPVIHRGRGNPDFERVSMQSGHRAGGRVRLHVDREP